MHGRHDRKGALRPSVKKMLVAPKGKVLGNAKNLLVLRKEAVEGVENGRRWTPPDRCHSKRTSAEKKRKRVKE